MLSASNAHHWMERDPVINTICSLHLRIVDKEVSTAISRETGGNGSRRSLHEVESEDPDPVNGRWSIRPQSQRKRLRVDILAL
jgi:hypothetical protein